MPDDANNTNTIDETIAALEAKVEDAKQAKAAALAAQRVACEKAEAQRIAADVLLAEAGEMIPDIKSPTRYGALRADVLAT